MHVYMHVYICIYICLYKRFTYELNLCTCAVMYVCIFKLLAFNEAALNPQGMPDGSSAVPGATRFPIYTYICIGCSWNILFRSRALNFGSKPFPTV